MVIFLQRIFKGEGLSRVPPLVLVVMSVFVSNRKMFLSPFRNVKSLLMLREVLHHENNLLIWKDFGLLGSELLISVDEPHEFHDFVLDIFILAKSDLHGFSHLCCTYSMFL